MARMAAALLLAPLLAGCLTAVPDAGPAPGAAWTLQVPVDVNVVLVGFGDRLDAEGLVAGLPTSRPVFYPAEFGRQRHLELDPVELQLRWRVHRASEDFARSFFAAADQASFEGPAPAFLVDYDRASGQQRLAHPPVPLTALAATPLKDLAPKPTMRYIDAPTLEQWVHDHRAEHGLAFPSPEYTLFLVDSYTDGYLPRDGYHYYYFDDGTLDAELDQPRPNVPRSRMEDLDKFHTPKDPTSNRGWGGQWGFAWIDVGAAPSWMDYEPWVPAFEDDNVDHPVWDLEGQDAKLHRNLARHLEDAALVKFTRNPIYRYEGETGWAFPVTVFVDSAALSGASTPVLGVDVETWLGVDRIRAAFEDIAPWMQVEVSVQYRYLPQDDPAMAAAIERAKAYGDPTVVSSEVVTHHIRENWDSYVPEAPPGMRVIPQFMFYFSGPWTFWGLNQGGGFAAGDGWGRPWAAFNHIFDACVKTEEVPCTKATTWRGDGSLDLLVIHEGGHHIGLHHARDQSLLAADMEGTTYRANWFWDSVWSVMTYRHQNPGFDAWDKDQVARNHAAFALQRMHARAAELRAAGASLEATAAEDEVESAGALLLAGRWQEAAARAVHAWGRIAGEEVRLSRALEGLPTRVVSFGATVVVPAGTEEPAPPLAPWSTTFEVEEGAAYLHVGIRDARPEVGPLRSASVTLEGPDGAYAGGAFGSVFDESFVTGLRGPGTYSARLNVPSGVASTYQVTLDVHYREGA